VHQSFGLDGARPGAGAPVTGGSAGATGFRALPAGLLEGSLPGRDFSTLAQRLSSMEEIVVSDVLLNTSQGRVTIFDLPDRPGTCSQVFEAVAANGIVVDMIVHNSTERGKAELSFSVPREHLTRAQTVTETAVRQMDARTRVVADPNIAKLFVLGVGMRTHTGVARRMFGALAERGINIAMINTSEVRVSVVVEGDRGEEALACLRETFHVGG
jgi:aspartate kinase